MAARRDGHRARKQAPARAAALRASLPKLPSGSGRWLLAAAAAGAALLLFGNEGFRTLVSSKLRLRELNGRIEELGREEESLRERIRAVKEDDHALERAVRRELGYQKPGEIEYRFPPPAPEEE